MEHGRYADKVVLEVDHNGPDIHSYTLVGSASHLRSLLSELLEAVDALERRARGALHICSVGDATGRFEELSFGIEVDADATSHRPRMRTFWRFYDEIPVAISLIIVILASIGFVTVVDRLF
jgi:hypothetical protein